jgi:flagellar hook-associated protein 3 FlgL
MRITHNMVSSRLLQDLRRGETAVAESQREVATGRRINKASDDPAGARAAVVARGEIAGLARHRDAVADATGWADATDAALSTLSDLLHRARELAVQGANGTATTADRARIADEIDQLANAAKDAGNARFGERYLFSGTATTTAPYAAGSDLYAGDANAVLREIGPGVTVQVNTLGSQILGSGQGADDGLMLDTLRDLAQHLRGGTAADLDALRTTDLAQLEDTLTVLSAARSTVGAVTNRLEAADRRLGDLEIAGEARLSRIEGADMAQAVLELSSRQSAYEAAMRSGASIIQRSLMDFLR